MSKPNKTIDSMRRALGGIYGAHVRARAAMDKGNWDAVMMAAMDARHYAGLLQERASNARDEGVKADER